MQDMSLITTPSGARRRPAPSLRSTTPSTGPRARMTEPIIGAAADTFQPADDPSIRPFHSTPRTPISPTSSGASRRRDGPTAKPSTTIRRASSWRRSRSSPITGSTIDWRQVEARINSYPNFVTKVDGLDMHFIHVKSKHDVRLPLIVTHGWPGSVIEQLKIIEPADRPDRARRNGGRCVRRRDSVAAGLWLFGQADSPGWGPERIAAAYRRPRSR